LVSKWRHFEFPVKKIVKIPNLKAHKTVIFCDINSIIGHFVVLMNLKLLSKFEVNRISGSKVI